MKISIIFLMLILFTLVIFCIDYSTQLQAGDKINNKIEITKCHGSAYVNDPDKNGVNVRKGPSKNDKIIGKIPLDKDGTMVNINGESNKWFLITEAYSVENEVVFRGSGWVYSKTLGADTRGYNTGKVNLYKTPDLKSEHICTIPSETNVTLCGCNGEWVKVEYKGKEGWLSGDDYCDNPVTNCC